MRINDKHIFFFSGNDILSNFFLSPQEAHGLTFQSNEQYFMWRKANYFGDHHIAERILNLPEVYPLSKLSYEAKKLGRQVTGFDAARWARASKFVMLEGLSYKAMANDKFAMTLIGAHLNGQKFVEASPYDTLWGVGLAVDDPLIDNPENWKGQNLLGQCLDIAALDAYKSYAEEDK